MGLKINQEKVTPEAIEALQKLCPFGGFGVEDGKLSFNAACKGCKLCVKKGPAGVVTFEEDAAPEEIDKSLWNGITVFCEVEDGKPHPVTLELLGKAKELASVIGHEVLGVMIGHNLDIAANEILHYGADKVYVYDDEAFEDFLISPYSAALYDFVEKVKPCSILVGATNLGRSLAPRVAARCRAGLTADCTVLKMKENTDLVQIRPAFGGNIMAQIVTPRTRPQFCTVRYKVFSAPERSGEASGEIIKMTVTEEMKNSGASVVETVKKPSEVDISEAEVIVAVGRGFKKATDIEKAKELADLLGGRLAGTRPMVESGWLDAKQQIGLSGRTVKPKLIICLGISGAIQFASGMNNSDYIVSVNSDPNAAIFDISHVGIVGDVYEVLPKLIDLVKGGRQ